MSQHPSWRIRCRHCKAPRRSPCVIPGTDIPLRYSAAHPIRCEDAGLAADTQAVERARKAHAKVGARRR